ncbi:sensor histidine kinase [Nocardia sp. CDC160]|uniref:sensor histidine kinase n=1 Tax=Nocardia sp. CDC160 TaxID=3112166 RepID=UPI002DB9BE94|nr:sensor histidine kinase [Nocardia sp. CDC160]MEC3916821.1 sensor histidine kinase [Nocardia sp. CDC160]
MTASDETPNTADGFVHPAYFYRGSEEYLRGTVGFIREGLAQGEPVAVSVPTDNLALIRAALGDDADSVRLLDMTVEGRNPGRIIPGVLRAFADAHPDTRVRIIGEPIWAERSPLEYPACVQHEALINAAFAGRDVTILCPYDLATLSARAIADAFLTHPTVIEDIGETASGDYDPDRVVDEYNRPLPPPPETAQTLAFDTATVATARHTAVAYARQRGMSEQRVMDLELIIGEATTNSVLHGGGRGVLAYWIEGSQFCCQVHDSGHITNPLAGRLPAPLRTPGGRGLLLINQLADLVRLHTADQGTTLRIHLPLAAAA